MLVLGTDLLTIIQRQEGVLYERLVASLREELEVEAVAITVVSLEEQMRGWLAYLNKASAQDETLLILGYERFHELFRDFQERTVLDFDETALERYQDLKRRKVRVPTMDLRVAAIVLANDATLITRNARDFEKVPGLRIEDWTKD